MISDVSFIFLSGFSYVRDKTSVLCNYLVLANKQWRHQSGSHAASGDWQMSLTMATPRWLISAPLFSWISVAKKKKKKKQTKFLFVEEITHPIYGFSSKVCPPRTKATSADHESTGVFTKVQNKLDIQTFIVPKMTNIHEMKIHETSFRNCRFVSQLPVFSSTRKSTGR